MIVRDKNRNFIFLSSDKINICTLFKKIWTILKDLKKRLKVLPPNVTTVNLLRTPLQSFFQPVYVRMCVCNIKITESCNKCFFW